MGRPHGLCTRDFYEDSYEESRVFGLLALMLQLVELWRRRLGISGRGYTRINQNGGITTAHESKTHANT